ncbi:putative cellular morphogenesis protein (Rax2) [Aspergillus undulatus]|uniref:putative cellular morphogenesis protein (Rax2) n=1 Tax=Aspergillus undulatus TaxID=1810928 RepID=UPI003CCD976C
MRLPSLFGPATAGSSTAFQVWLLSQLSRVSALSFEPVAQPELDLSRLGQVALAGDFDAVTFYSYEEQSNVHPGDENTQSILAPLPNGILTPLSTSDADIHAMCAFNQQDRGIYVGGNFTSLGDTKAQGIARYDPNSNKVTTLPGLSGSVSALLCDQETNTVYVGGDFKQGNTSNAAAWVIGEGWKDLSFGGLNGPVSSIVRNDDGNIVFGGSFDGINNSTSSKKIQQVINLSNATITSSTESTMEGFTDPKNIICQTSGAGGAGETWLLKDYALGFWRADMRYNFSPSKLRVYNTHFEGRGTKSFLFRRLPDNGIMNLTYTDPDTGDDVSCDQYCSLSDSEDEEYRDFEFVNTVGMTGFQFEIRDYYGKGAGLNGIEVYTRDVFTYAINDFNEPTCGDSSDTSTATQTGSWTVTEGDDSPSDYLTAQVSDSNAGSTSVVFEPNVQRSGNYSILVYTPGCDQDGTCDSRGIVNVTATVQSDPDSDEPIETQLYQTNNYEKYDTIYTGPVDASDDSFRPRVTLTPVAGQGDITVVASRVKFELRSASNGTNRTSGGDGGDDELNGLFEYDPTSNNVTTDLSESTINSAGMQLDSSASIKSLVTHGGTIYAAGNFSGSDISNVFSLEQDGNATAMPQGGLNSEVTTMSVLNNKLYVGGNFTGTSEGDEDLNYVASYSFDSQSWSALGGGVNGHVKRILALPLNISTDLNETIVALSGDFDELLAFDDYPAVPVSGFAAWVPSRNNWAQNLNVSQTQFTGYLSAFAKFNGTTILGGSIVSGGIAAGGAVALLQEDELQLEPLLSSAQAVGQIMTGIYDTSSGRNRTILGGHFNVTVNGSTVHNMAFLENGTINGLGNEVDTNSTFLSFSIASDILYAGGRVTGAVGKNHLSGLVLYDLQNGTIASQQPSELTGDDVSVNSIDPRPDSDEIYVGGTFSAAAALACPGICYYDTKTGQWNRPGVEFEGSVLALKWVNGKTLMAIGNLTVAGSETSVATYSAEEQTWKVFDGASTSSIPGTVTAFSPASGDVSTFWLAGQSDDGTNFVVNYDGANFQSPQEIFDDGTVIRGLDVLPLADDHDDTDLLNNDLALLVTGDIVVPNFGAASAALFNGTTLTPFIISSTSDGQPGRMSRMFYENSNPYARESGHRSNGIVVLVAFCCALGCVFLIVIAGVIFNKIQRRRQGYMAAPQATGTDRPTSMRRLPPEYLFNSLKQPNPGAPAI